MLCADGEKTPEVYSAAYDRDQASLVYRPTAYMVKKTDLHKHLKILDSQKRIINPRNNGFYQVLSKETGSKHGINPSCILFDELHAQKTDELWRILTTGTDVAREQQLVFVMSTAGVYDKNSIWWRIREKARQVKDGIIKDDTFLPVLYIADPEKDDPDDEEVWKRTNPSLGHIFDIGRLRKDYERAKQNPIDFEDFKRFRLNIPIKQLSRWMPMREWDSCGEGFDPAVLEGRSCYGGLDLSHKLDLTAFVLVFPFDGFYYVIPKFYCPQDTIMNRSRSDRVPYHIWAEQGFLTATSGNVIDMAYIERDVIEASKKYNLMEIGFDPWGATDIANRLMNDNGIAMVEMRQGAKTLSEPAKDLLVKVMTGKVRHGGHPVLRWNADNLVMVKDANENVRPDKEKATDRIDGMVALIMAWGRMLFTENEESPYNERGVYVVG